MVVTMYGRGDHIGHVTSVVCTYQIWLQLSRWLLKLSYYESPELKVKE